MNVTGSPTAIRASACVPPAGADVEELLVQLRRRPALVHRDDVAGLAAADGVHGALAAVDHEVAARHQQRSEAADALDEDVALLVDVRDDEADLVGVGGDADQRSVLRPHPQPHVAQGVAPGLTERRQAAADHVLHRRLEPGRTRGQAERPQQIDVVCHRASSFRKRLLTERRS